MDLAHQAWSPRVVLVSVSLFFFSVLPSGWLIGAWEPSKTTYLPGLLRPTREGALRWGTVHDLRGRRWPPWSERVQCHILAFCVNQLDQACDLSALLSFCQHYHPEGIPGSNQGWTLVKTMASGPITSWEIDRETVETVSDFIFGGSKIIADGDCSHEIKRCLLLGRKVMTNLDSILKSRDITLPTKVCLVKAMVFPVVIYGCESWTVKKAEHQRIDAFELWCWRRLLKVPWTARRSNQSILKEIIPRCSLEGLMLKLKLQYFGHLMWRVDSLEKTLMLGGVGEGGEGDNRGWDGWMASPTRWTWVWVNSGSLWQTRRPGMLWFMGSQRVGHNWATELNWP